MLVKDEQDLVLVQCCLLKIKKYCPFLSLYEKIKGGFGAKNIKVTFRRKITFSKQLLFGNVST